MKHELVLFENNNRANKNYKKRNIFIPISSFYGREFNSRRSYVSVCINRTKNARKVILFFLFLNTDFCFRHRGRNNNNFVFFTRILPT